MSTLYLPTSSLNFNSILAGESLSPARFYAKRSFGYRRFEKVGPNALEDDLLLYSQCPSFEIADRERENLPIIVAIDDTALPGKYLVATSHNVDVYAVRETVYLTPFDASVLFRTEREMKAVLASAARSIETKLVDLYRRKGCFRTAQDVRTFAWTPAYSDGIPDVAQDASSDAVARDARIDRLKGFMYAYALGAFSSMPKYAADLVRHARAIRNAAMSIANGHGDAPEAQWNELLKSILSFDMRYSQFHGPSRRFFEALRLEHQKDGIYGLLADLTAARGHQGYHRFISDWKRAANLYYVGVVYDELRRLRSDPSTDLLAKALSEMETQVADSARSDRGSSGAKLPSFVLEGLDLSAIADGTDRQTCAATCQLAGELLANRHTVRDLTDAKLAVARSLGLVIKRIIGPDRWEGSASERYVNGLLKNVALAEPFDLGSLSNLLLQSLAAFILKGDDIEKLRDFLLSNSIGDLRIAFGLHGALAGFASLPKTAMGDLLDMADADAFDAFYRTTHALLHGRVPPEVPRELPPTPQLDAPQQQDTAVETRILAFDLAMRKGPKTAKAARDSYQASVVPKLRAGSMTEAEFIAWAEQNALTKQFVRVHIAKLFAQSDEQQANPKASVGSTDSSHRCNQPEEQYLALAVPPVVPASTCSKPEQFVTDPTCAGDLSKAGLPLQPPGKTSALCQSLRAFQQYYQEGGRYAARPAAYPRDNANTIDHFRRCLTSEKTPELNVPLTPTEREELANWLRTRYACNRREN